MAHHDRSLPRSRFGFRGGARFDFHSDGWLVPIVSDAVGGDGSDSVFAGGNFAGARRDGRVFHRHVHDRVHGRRGRGGRNSIILVDFIEQRLREGLPLAEAVVDAGAVRFRPMLLTALAVVVGASVILADPIFQGLAISLMAGEIASLLISRMAVPVLYFMAFNRSRSSIPSPPFSLNGERAGPASL